MCCRLPVWLLAFGVSVALLLPAASASPHGESQRGGTLRLMWRTEPDSLDPASANGRIGSWVLLRAICATLFTTAHDLDTGKTRVVPEVALREPAISDGGRTYTFELRRTFRFDTGARVTARSFARAFHRNALMRSPATPYMQEIVGADAVIKGRAKRVSGVQALGRYRLRVRLKRRTVDFGARLTMPYFCPILPGTPNSPIDKPAGSGPYHIADHVPNRRIILERNRFYGGGRTANPDRVVWRIETDLAERLRATEQGENDFLPLFGFPDAVVRDLIEKYGLNRPGAQVLRDSPTRSNFLFRFNTSRPAFSGVGQAPLRKAINYVIDRSALARAHGYRAVTRSDRLLPATFSTRGAIYPLDRPDPVRAERLLARVTQPPRTLTLYTVIFPFTPTVAQTLTSNLKQLDIEVDTIAFGDLQTLFAKLDTPGEPWDVAWLPSGAPYPDPAGALSPLLRDTQYEARMNAANRVTDAAARAKAWADLEAHLMRNDPPVAAYADFTPLAFVSRKNFDCWSGADAYLDVGAVCKK